MYLQTQSLAYHYKFCNIFEMLPKHLCVLTTVVKWINFIFMYFVTLTVNFGILGVNANKSFILLQC